MENEISILEENSIRSKIHVIRGQQVIYILMTVLKGDLAVTQSKMLIRTFKEMKHFIPMILKNL